MPSPTPTAHALDNHDLLDRGGDPAMARRRRKKSTRDELALQQVHEPRKRRVVLPQSCTHERLFLHKIANPTMLERIPQDELPPTWMRCYGP